MIGSVENLLEKWAVVMRKTGPVPLGPGSHDHGAAETMWHLIPRVQQLWSSRGEVVRACVRMCVLCRLEDHVGYLSLWPSTLFSELGALRHTGWLG